MFDHKLSSIIQYKLPEFVRDENEMFVAFIQAYFKFLEQDGNLGHYMGRFKRNLDIDLADSDFVDRYVAEFARTFPNQPMIPTQQLIKLIREFYLAKGSEDSFRFIFTILFNADIEIIYPRDYMYVPSSGEYDSDIVICVTGTNWFKMDLDNAESITIEGVDSGAQAVIDSVVTTFIDGEQILKFEVSSYSHGFTPNEQVRVTVNATTYIETVLGALSHIEVIDGGTNYTLNDPIEITDTHGTRAKAKISQLAKGGYTQATIVNGGTGYSVGDIVKAINTVNLNGYGFRARVNAVDGDGAITQVRIEDTGRDYSKKTFAQVKSTSGGIGAVIELNGELIGKIRSIEVFDGGTGFVNTDNIQIDIISEHGVGASIVPVLDGIFIEPKRYVTERSTPSGSSKIMDSYYYQQYSYVIGSEISPHKWLGAVKRIAHPSGTQLFGMLKVNREIDVSISLPEDVSSSFARNLPLYNVADFEQELSSFTLHSKLIYRVSECSLGSNIQDIDFVKFSDNFDWKIGDFSDITINDIEQLCGIDNHKIESSYRVISGT